MLLSQNKKLLFVHIQKTGGTSIQEWLKNEIFDLVDYRNRHSPITEAEEKYRKCYFKAAFVRNPYDRLVSWYAMIERIKSNLSPEQIIAYPNRVQKEVMLRCSTFSEFILNCEYVKSRSGWLPFHKNQIDYMIEDNGHICIDFIGRYERLQEDIDKLADILGIE